MGPREKLSPRIKNKGIFVTPNKILALLLITILTSGCAFVPAQTEEQPYRSKCPMVTKKLTLENKRLKNACSDNQDIKSCLFVAGVLIPAGSLIVSGSLVLAGNTVHWLEYQTTCESSTVLKGYNKIKESMTKS